MLGKELCCEKISVGARSITVSRVIQSLGGLSKFLRRDDRRRRFLQKEGEEEEEEARVALKMAICIPWPCVPWPYRAGEPESQRAEGRMTRAERARGVCSGESAGESGQPGSTLFALAVHVLSAMGRPLLDANCPFATTIISTSNRTAPGLDCRGTRAVYKPTALRCNGASVAA